MQLAAMPAEVNTMPKNLKFKITCKGIRPSSEDKLPEKIENVVANFDQEARVGGLRRYKTDFAKPPMPVNCKKRRPEISLDSRREKKRKMDYNLKRQCFSVLKELMTHPRGWVFNKPVDPVELNIPDYFKIITEPMDLGTIKHKLHKDLYLGAEDFAADVRLTFSNAMVYNPPENDVHKFAKDFSDNFSKRWKLVEAKLNKERKTVEGASSIDDMEKDGQKSKQRVEKERQEAKHAGINKASLCVELGRNRTMSVEEKRKFRSEILQLLSRKIDNLRTVFQKFGLTNLNKERLDSYIGSTDDVTLLKLRREIKLLLEGKDGKVELPRIAPNRCPSAGKTDQKEHDSQRPCVYVNQRGSNKDTAALCQLKNGSTQASSSDLSSDRSPEHNHSGDSKLDGKVKNTLASHSSVSGVDSDGPGIVLNEEISPRLSTPAKVAVSAEAWNSFDAQLSPKKALRAAMLKSRFADTIFKATHQALPNGQKSDPQRMQQEKERLEREQLKEKARIAAEMRAAVAASRRDEQDILMMQREREREAARIALLKMERTICIDESMDIVEEVEMLHRSSERLLEKFGLYLKDDGFEEEEDNAILNAEEGEILL